MDQKKPDPLQRLRAIVARTAVLDDHARTVGKSWVACFEDCLQEFGIALLNNEVRQALGAEFMETKQKFMGLQNQALEFSSRHYRHLDMAQRASLLKCFREVVPKA